MIGFSILILICYKLIQFIEGLYKKKSWYGPQFWPPNYYVKGYIYSFKNQISINFF